MQTTISITRSPRFDSLMRQLDKLPATALQAVGTAMARSGFAVLQKAVEERFSGKGPFPVAQHRLGMRSKRLKESLTVTPPQINASTGEVTQSFGSNVRYFLLHELGFTGRVQVRSHTRKAVADKRSNSGKLTKDTINRRKNSILVKGRQNYANVKAHTRNLTIAARAPMTTELQSERTRKTYLVEINRELELAIDRMQGGAA